MRGMKLFERQDNTPFGYLVIPDVPQHVLFQDKLQLKMGFNLDWLDHSGSAMIAGHAIGLGLAYDRSFDDNQRQQAPKDDLKISWGRLQTEEELRLGPLMLKTDEPDKGVA